MAGKIRGVTIEIGADTKAFNKALGDLDKSLKTTKANLKDINNLLKLDPKNTELLAQKQKNLQQAVKLTSDRLDELKNAQSKVQEDSAEWDALQREIVQTENDLKNLTKEMREFGSVGAQKVKAVGQELEKAGNKIKGAGEALTPVSAAAGAVAGGLLKLGKEAITSADDLNTLSKQTGISTGELQKMKYASDLVDVSLDDITGAMKKLKGNMDPANNSFKKLGVSVTNADGSFRSATDVFDDTVKALSNIKNETERDKAAMEIFGKSADSLAGIIDDGGAAFRQYGKEAEAMGIILSQDTLDALSDTNDVVDKLKMNMAGTAATLGATVAQKLAPSIEKFSGVIATLTEKIRNLSPEQVDMILKIAGIVAAIAPLLIVGGKLIGGIGKILQYAPLIKGAIMAMNPTFLAVAAAIAVVVAAGVAIYRNWDTIKAKAMEIRDAVAGAWQNLKDRVSGAIDALRGKIDAIKQTFESFRWKVMEVINYVKGLFNFQWRLPHLSLPHIQISYTPASSAVARFFGIYNIPHLSVKWYKRAYDNPVMFTSPTVLQTPTGAKGFGDGNGAEIVLGLNKLRQLVGTAGDTVINVYAAPGQDINALADAIQDRFVALQKQKELAYGT